jgi:hypothetical protein
MLLHANLWQHCSKDIQVDQFEMSKMPNLCQCWGYYFSMLTIGFVIPTLQPAPKPKIETQIKWMNPSYVNFESTTLIYEIEKNLSLQIL